VAVNELPISAWDGPAWGRSRPARNPASRAGQGEPVSPGGGGAGFEAGARVAADGVVRRLRDVDERELGRPPLEASIASERLRISLGEVPREDEPEDRIEPEDGTGGGGPNRPSPDPARSPVPGTGGADPERVDRREPDSSREDDSRLRDGVGPRPERMRDDSRRAARYSFISSARRAGSRSE
jgi:hypothetical protein